VTGFTVTEHEADTRLDLLLAHHLEISRSRAAARIDAGEVRVDGEVVTKRRPVPAGAEVVLDEVVAPTATPPPALPPVRYQDEHLLVVAKPAGLVVHPGAGHPDGTLVEALQAADVPLAPAGGEGRPGIVHRLDRDTSGLLLVACTDAAHRGLVDALAARQVRRRYLALVAGVPSDARGRIEAPIGRDPRDRVRFAVVAAGKPATTRYRTLATGTAPGLPEHHGEVALLTCQLGTGRTHQLRVHLSELGHPIVGDPTYRAPGAVNRALGLTRPFLHAASLAFTHPITGAAIDLVEPLPDALLAVLEHVSIPAPDPRALTEPW
jgi:23S rRNA pseudouridine1911/1915/1917 synthase